MATMGQLRDRSKYFTSEGIALIEEAMQAKGWGRKDLAEKVGIAYETLGRYFRGKQPPQRTNIESISNLLGLKPSDLVEEWISETKSDDTKLNLNDLRIASKNLLDNLKRLTTEALTAGDGIRFEFDDVFVPLGVVERQQKTKRKEDDGAPDRGSELYEEKVTPITHDEFFEDVLLWGNTRYSDGKRIAVIGEAGAGKTTQLQKIGSWLLEERDDIPVWISLTDLGAKSLREYLFENWVREASGEIEAAPQVWKDSLGDAIKSGKVWLLLDGVDEMTVSNPLSHLSTQLNESWLKNVRVVLTCRVNVWEGDKNALTRFDVYRNLDFDYPDDVYKFIGKWFARAPELAGSLTQALEQSGKERIRDMVKNPLRLTLLCYSWQLKQGELPETKAGLYEWFVEAFYKWNKDKAQIELSRSREDELNRALGELAKRAIDGETSRFRLTKTFIENVFREFDIDLFDLALKLNWLNEIGVAAENPLESVYAFYHPSFQEYFAALAINDWDFFLPNNHTDKPVKDHNDKYKEYRAFETRWEEVILFGVGRKSQNIDKESFIKALIEFEDGCQGFYWHRAYFLAAICLIEFRSCKFAKQIIEQIIEWTYTYSHVNIQWSDYGFYISSLDSQAYTLLITLSQFQVYNKLIIDRLNQLLESPEIDENSSVLIAEILGTIDFGNPNALSCLVQIIIKKAELKSYNAQYWRPIDSLKKLASGDSNTISMLTKILQYPLISEDTHSLVLSILKEISVIHIEENTSDSLPNLNNITNSLEELKRFLECEYIQYRKIMPKMEEWVDIVNMLIKENKELDIKLSSTYSDAQLFFSEKIVDIVNEEIAKNKELEIKRTANFIDIEYFFYRVFWCKNNELDEIVWSLEKVAVGNTESISVLVDTLKHGQFDNYIRYRLAKCLGTIDRGNIEACSSLIKIILENKHLCNKAVNSLSEIAVGNAEVISILVNILQNGQLDENTRYNLAKILGEINTGNITSVNILIEFLLKSINKEHPDASKAELLGRLGAGNSDVINLFLEILSDTKSTDEMCNSVLVGLFDALNGLPEKGIELWKLDVIRAVEAALQRTPVFSNVNWLAANVLGFVDAGNTTAISALSNLLLNFESYSSYNKVSSVDYGDMQNLVSFFTDVLTGGSVSSWKFAVNKLREGVNNKTYKNIYNNFNCCYEALWHCAQNMGYQDFYDGWHSSTNTIQYLEHQLLDCDAIQKELDRNTDHPKIRCLVIDIRHLEQESDPNVIAKKLTNKIFNSIGRRIPVVQDVSCLERELLNLKFEFGFEKLAIALYGKSANEAIHQLCQSLAPSIPIRPFTGGQTTQELITQINAWLSEM